MPALQKTGATLKTIASASGVTSTHLGRKFGFELSTTETESIFADPEVNTVVITTRHNSHARYVLQGLRAGKRIYVEKPLCLKREELEEIIATCASLRQKPPLDHQEATHAPFLMVGFNRRFAPQAARMQALLGTVKQAKTIVITVNAGMVPATHWTQDPAAGGGRILGEACHFVDLLRFLVGKSIAHGQTMRLGGDTPGTGDTITLAFSFEDGSIGTIHYFANGHKSFPKERVEAFCAGRILQLDNFRKLRGFGWPGFARMNLWSQDKGHHAEMAALVAGVQSGAPPIAFDEIVEVTRACFDVVERCDNKPGSRPVTAS